LGARRNPLQRARLANPRTSLARSRARGDHKTWRGILSSGQFTTTSRLAQGVRTRRERPARAWQSARPLPAPPARSYRA
jgi:hypothetical protein